MTAAPVAEPRSWGDGRGDRRPHVIEDISYSVSPNFIVCRCGTRMEADTSEELASSWTSHGGRQLRTSDMAERSDLNMGLIDKADLWLVWSPAVAMSLRCTCATLPVELCPNYMRGDEHV